MVRSRNLHKLQPIFLLELWASLVLEHPFPLSNISTICQLYFVGTNPHIKNKVHDKRGFQVQNGAPWHLVANCVAVSECVNFVDFQALINPIFVITLSIMDKFRFSFINSLVKVVVALFIYLKVIIVRNFFLFLNSLIFQSSG